MTSSILGKRFFWDELNSHEYSSYHRRNRTHSGQILVPDLGGKGQSRLRQARSLSHRTGWAGLTGCALFGVRALGL